VTSPVLFSSASDNWPTTPEVFARLNRRFGPFHLDPAASPENAKAPRYFTVDDDGLQQPWRGRVWLNPPYGKVIGRWLAKAVQSVQSGEAEVVVCLLPARVDTKWWQDTVIPFADHVEFPRGRLRFGDGKYSAPFPSAVVVFRPHRLLRCQWCEQPYRPKKSHAKFCSAACKQAAYRGRRVTDLSVTQADADGVTCSDFEPQPSEATA
jgi:site-specific DNA-methyltransferase (adenine-specific)